MLLRCLLRISFQLLTPDSQILYSEHLDQPFALHHGNHIFPESGMIQEAPAPAETSSFDSPESSVDVRKRGWLRRLFAFSGPAYLVSVGYMDPGNWATDIEGGARFGYALVWVLLMSNIMAVLLQTLSARLGVVTGHDLAQACRREYPKPVGFALWVLAEVAIAACDLAEVLGTIIGLNLLCGLPLLWGCLITLLDTFLLLGIQRMGVRKMEGFIIMLIGTIGLCFLLEMVLARPSAASIVGGLVPRLPAGALYVAIGIIGATVMPHNLYLHSSLVQSRAITRTFLGRMQALRYNLIDTVVALNAALFVNAAILIMAAANFFSRGIEVTEIQQAHRLLEPILGDSIAPVAFAVALVAAGQSSTLTGTLAGQIIMEGFLNIKLKPWLRRLLTRSIAIIPAVIAIIIIGDEATYRLLILSQVILSLQLPFAVIPLIHITSDSTKMGAFANKLWVKIAAWTCAAIIVGLNLNLVYGALSDWLDGSPWWLLVIVTPILVGLLGLLGYITFAPLFGRKNLWKQAVATTSESVAAGVRPIVYTHIGVALEHTDGDAEIISAALSLAGSQRPRMTLLHVVETAGTMVYGEESASIHQNEDALYLQALIAELSEQEVDIDSVLCYGSPVEQIIRTAEKQGFDVLVLGSHGHRGFQDVVHGQTVTGVRHGVRIPVLVVRTGRTDSEQARRFTEEI